ncbi:MAG: hypothetical protein JRN58_06315 [Nitrososphaerota archaeon]|jgi:hypothetical protein|nr:hypothetical protein [Nitrososphaerota archaeon]
MVAFVPVGIVAELETVATNVLWVSATLETVEVELPEGDDPIELELAASVAEIPELEAVDPVLSTEYTAIPAASTTATIAAIQVGRIGGCSCGRSFLKPWFQCSVAAASVVRCTRKE